MIDKINTTVSKWGCIVLSTEYSNRTDDLLFGCKCGKQFTTSWKNLQNRIRQTNQCCCPNCSRKKWSTQNINKQLSKRSVSLVDGTDVDNLTSPSTSKLQFECDNCGHHWSAVLDNVINKNSGCPKCAGNIPYTINTLSDKLGGRSDLSVCDITDTKYRMGTFRCAGCNETWQANIHNVIKFHYGCPTCHGNLSTPMFTQHGKFHSKLEYFFWTEYHKNQVPYHLLRQVRYTQDRRLTVDYMIPELLLWIEISGQVMLTSEKYQNNLHEKQQIVHTKYPNADWIVLTTHSDIIQCINMLTDIPPRSNK